VAPSGPAPARYFSRPHEFGDLANVAEIVERPFVHHLGERDFARLSVEGFPIQAFSVIVSWWHSSASEMLGPSHQFHCI
jgi:hypothetical protein